MQQHIFSAAEAKLNNILLKQFDISLRLNALSVHIRAICRAEVNDIRSDSSTKSAVSASELYQPKLQRSMLLGARWMINWYIGNSTIATKQKCTLPMQMKYR